MCAKYVQHIFKEDFEVAYKQYYFPLSYKTSGGDWIEIDFLQYGAVALTGDDLTDWNTDLAARVAIEAQMITDGDYTIPDPALGTKWPTANVVVNGTSYLPARVYSVTSTAENPFTGSDFFSKWADIMKTDANCYWPTCPNNVPPAPDVV